MERNDVDSTKNLNEPPSGIIAFQGELKPSRGKEEESKGH